MNWSVDERFALAGAMVELLRRLKATKEPVSYKTAAREIGLLGPDEPWTAATRTWMTNILNIVAAVDKYGVAEPDFADEDYRWIVAESSGEPGEGFYKSSRIVTVSQQKRAIEARWAKPGARKAAARRMKAAHRAAADD